MGAFQPTRRGDAHIQPCSCAIITSGKCILTHTHLTLLSMTASAGLCPHVVPTSGITESTTQFLQQISGARTFHLCESLDGDRQNETKSTKGVWLKAKRQSRVAVRDTEKTPKRRTTDEEHPRPLADSSKTAPPTEAPLSVPAHWAEMGQR